MIEGSTDLLAQSRNNSLANPEVEGVVGAEALPLVFHVQRDTSLINDNYCVSPRVVDQVKVWWDSNMQTQTVQPLVQNSLNCHNVVKLARNQKYQRHLKQIVSCHVANRAPNFRRASTKERYKA